MTHRYARRSWARQACGVVATALLASVVGAAASAPPTPPNPKDLTQGQWALNVAKSTFCGPAPQKSTRSIIDAGWGLVATSWSGVNAQGRPTSTHYVARYDGEKYPSTIDRPANEAITWKLVEPHRVEFVHWSKDDKITSEYVRTVSEDGQVMTQRAKVVGRPCEEVQVFDRQ